MSVIDKKKKLLICLIILAFIVLFIIEIITYLESDKDSGIQVFNTASLQTTTNKEENEVEKVDNSVKVEIEKEKEITIINNSEEIIELNSCNWSYQDANFDGEYETEGNEYYYKGFTLTREKKLITRIVFNEDYEGKIISGITVGMDFDDIEKILGKPTFNKDNMIGYITQNLYIFIYEDEIAVYQNEFFANEELEKMLVKYYTGEYKGSVNDFSRYIRNNYDDFLFSSDENKNTYLTSNVRGMVIKLDDSITVELYKEYDSSEVLTSKLKDNIEIKDEYMIEVLENERNLGK